GCPAPPSPAGWRSSRWRSARRGPPGGGPRLRWPGPVRGRRTQYGHHASTSAAPAGRKGERPANCKPPAAPAPARRAPGCPPAPETQPATRRWPAGGRLGPDGPGSVVQDQVGDDAGGDGHQEHVAAVVADPVVAVRRTAQVV